MISLDLHFGKLTLATVYGMYQRGKEVQAGHLGGCGASRVRGGVLDRVMSVGMGRNGWVQEMVRR